MRINKLYFAVGLVIAFALFLELAAHADPINESTKITFSAPVQIPGRTLPAGSYLFELADSAADLNVVRIFSADRSVLYATLRTVPTDRRQPGDTAIILAKPGNDDTEMLVKWFYPGTSAGHQFVYSKQQEQEIAHAAQETFVGDQRASSLEAGE